jgi:hypothetical protein
MASLKTIVFFMIALQLGIMIISQIEIIPGVFLTTTASIGNASILYDSTYGIKQLSVSSQLIGRGLSGNVTSQYCVNPVSFIPFVGPFAVSSGITVFLPQEATHWCASSSPIFGDLNRYVQQTALLLIGFLALFGSLIIVLIQLIINSTIGSFAFYTSLFQIIDYNLGQIFGAVLGIFQSLLVLYYFILFVRGKDSPK